MLPPSTDLITPEEAENQGAYAAAWASVCVLDKAERIPYSIQGVNVQGAREVRPGIIMCIGVVMRHEIKPGDHLVITRSQAPLLGFYNSEPGLLSAAWGTPEKDKFQAAINVAVIAAVRRDVKMPNVFFYDDVILSEAAPESATQPLENR